MIIFWLLIGRVCSSHHPSTTPVLIFPPHRFYHTVIIIHHDFSQIHYEVVHFLIHSKLWKRHHSKFLPKFVPNFSKNKLWNQPHKVGCVLKMIMVTILPHVELRRNDHQEDATHFMRLISKNWEFFGKNLESNLMIKFR